MLKLVGFARAIGLILALVVSASSGAAIRTVTSGADSGPGSLRQEIAAAVQGDTITFAPDITTITLTTAVLGIAKNLYITGPGPDRLTVRRSADAGTPEFSIFSTAGNIIVTISGLKIENGRSSFGAGIRNNLAYLTIANCWISNNVATDSGGGIYSYVGTGEGSMTIYSSSISGNTADTGGSSLGGGIFSTGSLTISGSTISGNSAFSGGGIYSVANGWPSVVNSTITANTAGSSGGGVVGNGSYLRNTILAQNTVPQGGGTGPDFLGALNSLGWNFIGSRQNASISPSNQTGDQIGLAASPIDPLLGPLQDNGGPAWTHSPLPGSPAIDKGSSGGAKVDQRGFVRPVDTPDIPNASGGDGADIGAYEVPADQLPGCTTVVDNNSDSGAGSLRDVIAGACQGSILTFAPNVTGVIDLTTGELVVNKTLSIVGPGAKSLTIQRSADGGTPAMRIFNIAPASITVGISGLTIANGSITGNGGGILNYATLSLTAVALTGNTARNGGGIWNDFGTLTIVGSTLSGNSVSNNVQAGSGGGFFNQGGTVSIVNSTLSGNTAIGPGGNSDSGGGFLTNVGSVTLTNSTITGNAGDLGGGLRNVNGGVVYARNTIIALNDSPSGPDVNGSLTSQGFNLIGTTAGATILPSAFPDQLGVAVVDVNLGPLQDNGGPTSTHALLAGSFAIDKGHSSGWNTDQRGRPRRVDIAAIGDAAGGDSSDIGAYEFSKLSLDVDGNGNYDALTDGLLIIRYLFGITGTSLTNGAIGSMPTRSTPDDVIQFLGGIHAALDVDGNNQSDALTDGLMILRYMFGLRGTSLVTGAIGLNATLTASEIEDYIQSLMP